MAHDVFISYASKDKVVADAVCASLEADHIRCYIAPRDVLPGQRYAQALVDAIHNAKAFVLVFSAASNASNQVEREVDRAVSCGLPILPLRVEDVMPCDWLEYYLAGQHWLDALTPPLEAHLTRLSEAIGVLLQPPAAGGKSPLADEWRGSKPAIGKPMPLKQVTAEPESAAPPAVAPPTAVPPPSASPAAPHSGAEKPAAAKRPLEYVPPRVAVPPSEVVRPAETVKPAVAEPPRFTSTPESKSEPAPAIAKPAPVTPAKPVPAAAKPGPAAAAKPTPPPTPAAKAAAPASAPVRPAPAIASAKPVTAATTAAAARAPAASPKAAAAAVPARRGRRTAVIAAAVVGVSWVGVLLALELLFR
jgi:hypothetical protein